VQFPDQCAEKLFRVAVRSDRLGQADEGLESSFKPRGGKNFRIVAHDFTPPLKQIAVRLMPDRAQLIHAAESEKDVFVAMIDLYRLAWSNELIVTAELGSSYSCIVLIR
jgi:hypothetical protein